jgi:hypothetical protein
MTTIPKVDNIFSRIELLLNETERKLDIMESNINTVGSNADIFLNSVWYTSNMNNMYMHLRYNSNVLRELQTQQ